MWRQGEKLFSILGHKHMIRAAVFQSRTADRSSLPVVKSRRSDVNTDYFGHMILTSADTGRKIREFTGHWHYVDCLAFTPKGERIATGGRDGTTIIWDAVSGKGMRGLESQDRRNIVALAFSPDGSQLLTGAEHWNKPSEAVLWDHAAGEQQRVAQVDGKVTSVSFSPDGQLFAAATRHQTYLYRTATGERLRTMVGSATLFTPDGQWMLGDGRIYDVATGELSVEIVRFGDGDDWLAVTEEGLLDGTPAAPQASWLSYRQGARGCRQCSPMGADTRIWPVGRDRCGTASVAGDGPTARICTVGSHHPSRGLGT